MDIAQLNEKIKQESAFVDLLFSEIGKVIVGQKEMVERLVVGLLGNGHRNKKVEVQLAGCCRRIGIPPARRQGWIFLFFGYQCAECRFRAGGDRNLHPGFS